MNIRRENLGKDLGLNIEGYVKLGLDAIMKRPCILCGGKPVTAGICLADGSDAARRQMQTPNVNDPESHRLAFFALCVNCKDDPAMMPKVRAKVLEAVNGNVTPTSAASAPLVDGQTFSL